MNWEHITLGACIIASIAAQTARAAEMDRNLPAASAPRDPSTEPNDNDTGRNEFTTIDLGPECNRTSGDPEPAIQPNPPQATPWRPTWAGILASKPPYWHGLIQLSCASVFPEDLAMCTGIVISDLVRRCCPCAGDTRKA